MRTYFLAGIALTAAIAISGCEVSTSAEASSESDNALAVGPNAQEHALLQGSGRWFEWIDRDGLPAGAVRGKLLGVGPAAYRNVFPVDNALLLAAMADDKYQWSRDAGYAAKLCELITTTVLANGLLAEGYQINEATGVRTPIAGDDSNRDDPNLPSRGLWGLSRFVRQRPSFIGAGRGAGHYTNRLVDMMDAEWSRAANAPATDTKHGSIAAQMYLMTAAANAFAATGKPRFKAMATQLWSRAQQRQAPSGAFPGGTDRNIEFNFLMDETARVIGDFDSLRASQVRLASLFQPAGKKVAMATVPGSADTTPGIFAGLIMAGDRRAFVIQGMKDYCTTALYGGRMYLGDPESAPGPLNEAVTENQGFGWLASTYIDRCD